MLLISTSDYINICTTLKWGDDQCQKVLKYVTNGEAVDNVREQAGPCDCMTSYFLWNYDVISFQNTYVLCMLLDNQNIICQPPLIEYVAMLEICFVFKCYLFVFNDNRNMPNHECPQFMNPRVQACTQISDWTRKIQVLLPSFL